MTTTYVTFGFDHRHYIGDETFDRNTVAKITAEDPRAIAFELFGRKWCTDYVGEKGEEQVAEWNYRVIEISPEAVAACEVSIALAAAAAEASA